MSGYDFDLFVIGGGSGGVRAGRIAASQGVRVALAEESRYGGTCVIRGCVPKKLMAYASSFSQMFRDARGFGWEVGETSHDWSKLVAAKDAEITRLERLYRGALARQGVELFEERAVLTGTNSVRLSSGREITAETILIATGGRPFVPDFPGSDLVVTSNEMFDLPELPKELVIVGGGYIASEFAGIMNGLGTKVHQFYRGEQILRGFDGEARGHVADAMIARGIDLHLGTDVTRVVQTGDRLTVHCTNGTHVEADVVMYATGRVPNTESLDLEAAGVETGKNGKIVVDAYSRTNIPNIYAVGDVTDRVQLTPVAIREAMAFIETVYNNNPTVAEHDIVPTAIFTQPELGTVGLSEEEAAEKYEIEVYRTAFRPMQHSLAGFDERMLMKLIVDRDTRKVLGCHIVGPAAGEMIQMAGIAVQMGATKDDFDRTVAIHPTAAEELVTMHRPAR